MTKPSSDPNKAAAEAVRKTTAKHEQPLPPDVEASWAQWIAGVGNVDERAKAMLRAAFEVGVESAQKVK